MSRKLLYSAGFSLSLLFLFFLAWEAKLRPEDLSPLVRAALLLLAALLAFAAIFLGGQDVRQEAKANERLRREIRDLKTSQAALEEFAAVAAHDLKEPLRKVLLFGDRLKHRFGTLLDEAGKDYLGRMQDAAGRMQTLIDALLKLARLDREALEFTDVDLGEVLRSIQDDLEPRIDATGARVEVGDLPLLRADRVQMQQLFQNLMSNALKFHQPDRPPEILIEARPGEREGTWDIAVSDRGIGVDEAHRDRVFKPFERLHGKGAYEGSGMGLAICQRIAERHGGSIRVESGDGGGARFVVCLPGQAGKSGEGE